MKRLECSIVVFGISGRWLKSTRCGDCDLKPLLLLFVAAAVSSERRFHGSELEEKTTSEFRIGFAGRLGVAHT